MTTRIATYRLQLQPNFTFADVCQHAEYYKRLGVSHIYTSPYLQAVKNSTHGYDVVDPTQINQDLGGESMHQKMCEKFRELGLGHMIDIVPNHMAIAGEQNPWWWDILENGPSSLFSTYFDVDWENTEERWHNQILLPVLGDHYGRVLERREISLVHDQGRFRFVYFEHKFPVDPSTLHSVLLKVADREGSRTLAFLAESYARMPRPSITARADDIRRRHRDKAVLFDLLIKCCNETPSLFSTIDEVVREINSDVDELDRLLEEQNYRLAYWRTASHDLGYRRFFDISDLAGLRVEDPIVFEHAHALPLDWVKRGWVDALRIDHSDGLRDPKTYFDRLRSRCPDCWIVTEKILEKGEELRSDWPVEGSTGYEFISACNSLLVKPDSYEALKKLNAEFSGQEESIEEVVDQSKVLVLNDLLQSELNRLASLFVNICEGKRSHRDFSRAELHDALAAVARCFSVYRTYVVPGQAYLHPDDKKYIAKAVACAKEKHPDLDAELLDFLQNILCLELSGERENELAVRFQQLTGAATAKGVEDTAFYRYTTLLGLNEVGGDPGQFGLGLDDFHKFAAKIQSQRPWTLLTSSTHDTKRSEDTRARMLTLSEVPREWQVAVASWRELAQAGSIHPMPGKVEYFIFQTLVGTWPIDERRMQDYMEKACREAKQYTSWTKSDESFEGKLREYISALYQNEAFCRAVDQFVSRVSPGGYYNSLSQCLLKMTAPGVPDVYQGCELWNFSLVDPDNRRDVDYDIRSTYLNEMENLTVPEITSRMEEGLPKMWLIYKALQVRRDYADAFSADSIYEPAFSSGVHANHVIAYIRNQTVAVVATRFNLSRPKGWLDTALTLPEGQWLNVFTGVQYRGGELYLEELSSVFPVALLVREDSQ